MTSWNAALEFSFIKLSEEEKFHCSYRGGREDSSKSSNFTHLLPGGPKSNRRLDIILGSTPTTSCAKHLVSTWTHLLGPDFWTSKDFMSWISSGFFFGKEISQNENITLVLIFNDYKRGDFSCTTKVVAKKKRPVFSYNSPFTQQFKSKNKKSTKITGFRTWGGCFFFLAPPNGWKKKSKKSCWNCHF